MYSSSKALVKITDRTSSCNMACVLTIAENIQTSQLWHDGLMLMVFDLICVEKIGHSKHAINTKGIPLDRAK